MYCGCFCAFYAIVYAVYLVQCIVAFPESPLVQDERQLSMKRDEQLREKH